MNTPPLIGTKSGVPGGGGVSPIPLPPHKSPAHVRYVSEKPCMTCGAPGGPAHHLLKGWCRSIKTGLVMRRTQTDVIVVPMCPTCHTELHDMRGDEDQFFWDKLGNGSAGRARAEQEWLGSPYWVDLASLEVSGKESDTK